MTCPCCGGLSPAITCNKLLLPHPEAPSKARCSPDDKETVKIDNKTYALKSEDKEYGFDLSINNEIIPIKIYDFIKSNSAFENNDNSDPSIVQEIQSNNYDLRIIYTIVSGSKKGSVKEIDNYEIKILVKIKN